MNLNETLWQFANDPSSEMLDDAAIRDTYVDPAGMEAFIQKWYLAGFVDQGAGKLKFVQGRPGSGKTHFLRHLALTLGDLDYQAVLIDGTHTRLAAIDELYKVVAQHIAWSDLVGRAAVRMIQDELGYHDFPGSPREFWGWAQQSRGRNASILHSDVRDASDRWIGRQGLDAQWGGVMRQWMLRAMEPEGSENPVTERWLMGERITAAEKKSLGVPGVIDRRNARAMLFSLAVFCHAAGYHGLAVLIDNGQVMATRQRRDDVPYYTRTARDQAYEMWRELIDDSHHAAYLFVMLAASPELFEDGRLGFPSYPALWSRIQSEIFMTQINRFNDLIDWDRLWSVNHEDLDTVERVWAARHFQGVRTGEADVVPRSVELDWSPVRRRIARQLKDALEGDN